MKKQMTRLSLVFVLPILLGFSASSQAEVARESSDMDCLVAGAKEQKTRNHERTSVEEEVMELEREGCRGLVSGDEEKLAAILEKIIADDGLIFADGGGIIAGKEAQQAMFKEFLGAGHEIEYEPTDAFVSKSEDMAWAYGLYRVKAPDGREDIGSYLSVWVKVGGEWKNVAEMRNSNQ